MATKPKTDLTETERGSISHHCRVAAERYDADVLLLRADAHAQNPHSGIHRLIETFEQQAKDARALADRVESMYADEYEAPPLERVTIYLADGSWMLDHRDDPSAFNVRALFDTTVIPMPFRATAPEALVRDTLARKNPGVIITRGTDR
jgi:hypothetical protein